ncbi:MAG: hypothetical protein ACJA2S_000198 [Cyclobacteriaceae bacterium]|jgi:hypothetical protein
MPRFILYTIIIIISFGCRSAGVIPSQFKTNISIDALDKDWPTLTKVDYREKYSFGVFNDYDNVYFLFKTFNPRLVEIISERGLTVWINGNGSKTKEIGITYLPAAKFRTSDESDALKERQGDSSNNRVGIIKGIQKKGMLYELIDLTEGNMIAALGKEREGKYLIYEAQFSFGAIRQFAREKNIDKGKLSLTLEFGPMVIRNSDLSTKQYGSRSQGSISSTSPVRSTGMTRLPTGGLYNVIPMNSNEEIYIKSILVKR